MLGLGPQRVVFTFLMAWTISTQSEYGVSSAALTTPTLGDDRIVFQTDFGDIEMALYADVYRCLIA